MNGALHVKLCHLAGVYASALSRTLGLLPKGVVAALPAEARRLLAQRLGKLGGQIDAAQAELEALDDA